VPQRLISRRVAVMIVEPLEMVDIRDDHGAGYGAELRRPAVKADPGADPGQQIMMQRMFKLRAEVMDRRQALANRIGDGGRQHQRHHRAGDQRCPGQIGWQNQIAQHDAGDHNDGRDRHRKATHIAACSHLHQHGHLHGMTPFSSALRMARSG